MKIFYERPSLNVLELKSEGVLCASLAGGVDDLNDGVSLGEFIEFEM